MEALKYFFSARELVSKVTIRLPGEEPQTLPDVEVKLKCVDGLYLVYSMPLGQGDELLYNIVTFDKGEGVYRRWTFILDGPVIEAIGIRNPNMPSVAWTNITRTNGGKELIVLGLETRVEGKTYYTESTYSGEKLQMTMTSVVQPKK